MSTDHPGFGVPEMPMISPQVANLLPYGLARRLCSVPVSATATEVTVMTARSGDVDAMNEIRGLTGRNVQPIDVPLEDIDRLLDYLSGRVDGDDLWLQHRHIVSLSRLADTSLNLGHVDSVRSLVDRALEFAPYSVELWLTKARVAIHRSDVVGALTIASQIAPQDRRIIRWMQSLDENDADNAPTTGEDLTWMPRETSAASEPIPFPQVAGREIMAPSSGSARLAEESFRAAREITALQDPSEVMRRTAESLMVISGADSASVYFQKRGGWKGKSTNPVLQARMAQALPKGNRVAAQVVKQGLPVVVGDTAIRLADVGPLIAETSIRSFALLPIPGRSAVSGLAYVNFDTVDRASVVFDPEIGKAIEVVLNSAGSRIEAVNTDDADGESSVDELTDTYSMAQFLRMLTAELERARRYRFSVSVLMLEVDPGRPGLTGDALQHTAATIRRVARASDVIAHGPTNQFAVMLPQTTAKGASLVARRLEKAIQDGLWAPGADCQTQIGSVTFPDKDGDAATLVEVARSSLAGRSPAGAAAGTDRNS